MPFGVVDHPIPIHRKEFWWFDEGHVESEIADGYPWLQKPNDATNGNLCFVCAYLNFRYLMHVPGTEHPQPTPPEVLHGLRISSLHNLRKRKDAGCPFCLLVWSVLCTFLRSPDLPEKIPDLLPNSTITSKSALDQVRLDTDVWYTISGQGRSTSGTPRYMYGRINIALVEAGGSSARSLLPRDEHDVFAIGGDLHSVLGYFLTSQERWISTEIAVRSNHFNDFESDTRQWSEIQFGNADGTVCIDDVLAWLNACQSFYSASDERGDDEIVRSTKPKSSPAFQMVDPARIVPTMFIDVEDLRVVEKHILHTEYVAVSYVWGTEPHFKVTQSNIDSLKTRKSLSAHLDVMHKVIRDSITVCHKLGVRYLWADALCIVQDSPNKLEQISQMHLIYSHAILSIVAGTVYDVERGLAGVRPNSRQWRQQIAVVEKDLTLINVLPPSDQAMQDCLWLTRGWTCQEGLLSQRILAFGPDRVHLLCQHGLSREDWLISVNGRQEAHFHKRGWSSKLESIWSTMDDNDLDVYARVVRMYSNRTLGDNDDVLNAFTGLMSVLAGRFRSHIFVCAIPVDVLDAVLFWIPAPVVRRRNTSQYLPTWAWISWVDRVQISDLTMVPCFQWIPDNCDDQDAKLLQDNTFVNFRDAGHRDRWDEQLDWVNSHPQTCANGLRHSRPGKCRHDASLKNIMLECLHIKSAVATLKWRLTESRSQEFQVLDDNSNMVGEGKFDNRDLAMLSKKEVRFVRLAYLDYGAADLRPKQDMVKAGRPGDPFVRQMQDRPALWQSFTCPKHLLKCWSRYAALVINEDQERIGTAEIMIDAFDDICEREVDLYLK